MRVEGRAALQPVFDGIVLETIPPVSMAAGAAYVISAMAGLAGVDPQPTAVTSALASGGAITIAIGVAARRGLVPAQRANLAAAAMVAIALANAALSLYLVPRAVALVTFTIVILGSSVLFLSRAWVMGTAIVSGGAALAASVRSPDVTAPASTALTVLAAGVIAIAVVASRGRTHARMENLRADAEENRRRYANLLEGVPVGVYRVTPDGAFLDASERAARILGHDDRDDLVGPFGARLHDDAAALERWRARIDAEGTVLGHEFQRRAADGTVRWIRDSARAVHGPDGRTTCYEGILEDVTAAKAAEAEVAAAREQVVRHEKLSALGTLVAGIAHEINNPLAYVRGGTEIIRDRLDELARSSGLAPEARADVEDSLDLAGSALRGIDRIAAIARSLRTIARDGGAARRPEDANAIVEGAILVARSRPGRELAIEADLRARRSIVANATEISQVVLNLLLNAADATEDVADATIRVRSRDEGDFVVLEVEDNGHGIPAAEQPHVFVPFHTTKPTGTGLGLSVSHGIVAAHHGAITFRSEPGRGTAFRVRLPASPVGTSG